VEKYSGSVFKGFATAEDARKYLRDYFVEVTRVHDLHVHSDVIHEDGGRIDPDPGAETRAGDAPARVPKPVMGYVVCNGFGELIGLASTLEKARTLYAGASDGGIVECLLMDADIEEQERQLFKLYPDHERKRKRAPGTYEITREDEEKEIADAKLVAQSSK
jgi:hypothetical protein